ncbi:unnamed protein product, partial [Vitrella brassicaformis CCMP3155]
HLLAICISFLAEWSPDMDTNRAAIKLELWRNSFDTFWDANLRFDKDNRLNGAFIMLQQFPGTTSFSDLKAVAPEAVAEVPIQIPMPSFESRFIGCPPGTFNDGLECRNCSANTFSDTTNATRCEFCPPGQGQPLEGQTSCTDCEVGQANPGGSAEGCRDCTMGTFSDRKGSSVCQRCATGEFNDRERQSGCTKCGKTRTTGELGSVSAKQCVCKEGYFFTGLYELVGDTNKTSFKGTTEPRELINATIPEGTCKLCNDDLYECRGSFHPPKAKDGFYMEAYDITYRDDNGFPAIYECSPRSSCEGGAPQKCKKHRTGIACGRCEDGYSKSRGGRCNKCSIKGNRAGFLIICLLVMLPIGAYFYSKTSYEDPRKGDGTLSASTRSVMSSRTDREAADDPNKAFLIILSFLQHIGIISSFNLKMPVDVLTLFSIPRIFMLDPSILSMSCWGFDTYGKQLAFTYSIPLIFVASVIVLHFSFRLLGHVGGNWAPLNPARYSGKKAAFLQWFRKRFIDGSHGVGSIRILATVAQTSSFLYVALSSLATAGIDCYRHPSGDYTVRSHPYIFCHAARAYGGREPEDREKEYRDQLWMVGLAMFLYIFCPYIIAIVVSFRVQNLVNFKRKNGRNLEESDAIFKAAFKYVVGKYRNGMVWWECIWMARNAVLALSTVLLPNLGQLQLMYYAVILTFYLSLAPWRRSANSKLDVALTLVLLHIITMVGLFYTFPVPDDNINMSAARFSTAVLLFVEVLALVPFLYLFGSGFKKGSSSSRRFSAIFQSSRRVSRMHVGGASEKNIKPLNDDESSIRKQEKKGAAIHPAEQNMPATQLPATTQYAEQPATAKAHSSEIDAMDLA